MNVKEVTKCLSYFDLLQKRGSMLPSSFINPLGDGLWELRPEFGGPEFRFFYFTVLNDTIIKLHAIKKKSRKTPESDLDLM